MSQTRTREPVPRPRRVLPAIVGAQFAGTSLWFAGNAVIDDLRARHGLAADATADLTSAVQLGFIVGTLLFALLNLADRLSPRRLFCICSVLGALANVATLIAPEGLVGLLLCRAATGVCLAGVYPVGMKLAASWYDRGLGNALGLLVGALVVGAAFPHLLRGLGGELPWQGVIVGTSLLAVAGGLLVLTAVPDGPHLPRASSFDPRALVQAFRVPDFRSSAFGYFGHMWELYAFWAFVPAWVAAHVVAGPDEVSTHATTVSLLTFATVVAGAFGCVGGGLLSRRFGSARVAAAQLAVSALCCLVSPLVAVSGSPTLVVAVLLTHGVTVVGDSPQYSALNAQTAPRAWVGSALTIATSIGFAITIPAIWVVERTRELLGDRWLFLPLAVGPLLGLWSLRRLLRG